MSGNPCLILEWSEVEEWAGLHGLAHNALQPGPRSIPQHRRPAVLQPNRAIAEAEAERLAAAHPGSRFAVFEATHVAMTVDVPSHVNVKGEVWMSRRVPTLVEIDDSEVPF